ncbi:MAG: lipopolysaccharide biosynthesis protein [Paludibacteraceae bacterium]|nr:lipopolysaccharide biosynthesis protein [Paludibacteraceae bacterium]
MTEDLRKKTKKSIFWNALDKVGFQVVALLIGLITARLLTPKDFGYVGALAIFTALSNILVESGFTSAMVRRKNNTDAEYMAVLLFNFLLSIAIYLVLFISAPYIAMFFKMPELESLSRFLFLAIVLNSFGLVQNIVLTQRLEFRVLSLASLISAVLSGIFTIVFIFKDFGYWALAWQIIMQTGFKSLLLWIFSSWKPVFAIDFKVIKELFSFSFSLIFSSVIMTTVRYIYSIVIGRNFTAQDLGYYSQAFKFHLIPSNVVSGTVSGVAYPVLSSLNQDETRQLAYFRKLIRVTAFVIFPVMLGLCVAFDNLVEVALTAKWLPIVPYFRILGVAAIFMPLHSMNISINTAKGYPSRSFYIETIRNVLVVVSLLFCLSSIHLMLISFSLTYFISYIIGTFSVRKLLPYKIKEQVMDILPYASVSILMGVGIYMIHFLKPELGLYLTTLMQILFGLLFYCISLYFLGSSIFAEVLDLLKKKL